MSAKGYIRVGERIIGCGQPCFIIAEAGVNHNGSLEMALKLVDVAVEAGADAVKFQKRALKNLYPSNLLDDPNSAEPAFQYLLPLLKQIELTNEEFRTIKARCDQLGIRFICTPWDETSLTLLEQLGVDVFKVASADLVNLPLLEQLVQTGKPLIVSTGMATLDEIGSTVNFLKQRAVSFALLHCVSTYPAPLESLNLRFMDTLKQFGVPVGYSSHERGIVIPVAAVSLGACIIEKHVTLDRSLPGPDHRASLEPDDMQRMIHNIRNTEAALGIPEKRLSTMEMLNRQVLRKSLVAARKLPAGTIVTGDMVKVMGPGKGLSPQRIGELIGVRLERCLDTDEYFTEDDLGHAAKVTIRSDLLSPHWGLKARFHDLVEVLEKDPPLVELHFSEADLDYEFAPPPNPYRQRLFVHAPEFADARLLDLCSVDDEARAWAIGLIQRTIDKAIELQPYFSGPPSVVIHIGGMSMDGDLERTDHLLQRAVASLQRLDHKGAVLLPENLPPRPWYLGGQWFQHVFVRAEEMIDLCRELGLGMTLDLSHAQLYCNTSGERLEDYVKRCLPYTRHLHIADASGIDGEGLQIGEGVIDWEVILGLLSKSDLTWVPEVWSGHLQGGDGFAKAINLIAQYDKL